MWWGVLKLITLIKHKKYLLITILAFLVVSACFYIVKQRNVFAQENPKYNTGDASYVQVDGSEFNLDTLGCLTYGVINGSAATQDISGNNNKPDKLYVSNFKRGVATFLNFNGAIDSLKYNYITIEWSKNINSRTTLWFYKNGDNITTDSPKDIFVSGEGKYEDKVDPQTGALSEPRTTFFVSLYLPDFADDGNYVSGIVIKHQTDEKSEEYDGFQLRIYSVYIENKDFQDYELNPDGEDFTVSAINGYDQNKIGISKETGKIFCNSFKAGSGVKVSLSSSVNSSIFKTLSLKLSLFLNGFSIQDYCIAVFNGNNDNIEDFIPASSFIVKSTNNKGMEMAYELNIPTELIQNEGNKVSSFIITHKKDINNKDIDALSLFIWGIMVKTQESQYSFEFPLSIENGYIEKNITTTKIIFEFDACVSEQTVESFCNVYKNITINEKTLTVDDVQRVVTGYDSNYNMVALEINNEILKENEVNFIKFSAGMFYICSSNFIRKYNVSGTVDFVVVKNTETDHYVALCKYGDVKNILQEKREEKECFTIKFNEDVVNINDNVGNSIKINGERLNDLLGTNEIALVNGALRFELSSEFLQEEKNVIEFSEGLRTDDLYFVKTVLAYKYRDDPCWYFDSNDSFTVLWFEKTDITNEELSFTIKISYNINEEYDISSSVFLNKISVNGKSLFEIAKEGDVSVVARGQFIDFVIDRAFVNIYGSSDDIITIYDGFTLPSGIKTDVAKTFKYSNLWFNYEVVPDRSYFGEPTEYTSIISIETASDTTVNKLSLHIEFAFPVSYRYYMGLQNEASRLYQVFSETSTSNPSELYLSELAFYGILDSCVNKIKFDGKTIEQWLEDNKIPGENWERNIVVSYLGTSLNNAYSRRISLIFNFDDELITLNKKHTIEFEEGFITPLYQTLNKTYSFQWDPENKNWSVFSNSEKSDVLTESGCSASVCIYDDYEAVLLTIIAVIPFIVIKKIKIEKRQRRK